mgnify:CR=1 FL=1
MGSIAAGAWAQADKGETSVDKTVDLNPVVVTGTGTHQRLKNTPAPVSVITANEIKRAGILSLLLPECDGFISDDERTFQ